MQKFCKDCKFIVEILKKNKIKIFVEIIKKNKNIKMKRKEKFYILISNYANYFIFY